METKCYCGHTTCCDCGPETLEEAAEKNVVYLQTNYISFMDGVKWQQERSYSEDDMIEFGKFMLLENHEYKSYQNIFNEWFEQFKRK